MKLRCGSMKENQETEGKEARGHCGPRKWEFHKSHLSCCLGYSKDPGTHVPRSSPRTAVPRHSQAKMAEWPLSRGELKVCPGKPYPIH